MSSSLCASRSIRNLGSDSVCLAVVSIVCLRCVWMSVWIGVGSLIVFMLFRIASLWIRTNEGSHISTRIPPKGMQLKVLTEKLGITKKNEHPASEMENWNIKENHGRLLPLPAAFCPPSFGTSSKFLNHQRSPGYITKIKVFKWTA